MTDASAVVAGTETPGAAVAVAAGATPWFHGKVDADILAHWQNKGYDVNDPIKVSTELTKAYREAEKLVGAPPTQVVRIPVDPVKDPDGMKAVFQRLGMPIDPKDYDFPVLKNDKGEVTDKALEAALRTAANDAFLTKEAANKVAGAITKHLSEVAKAKQAEDAAALADEKSKLAANWGTNSDKNKIIAQNAAAAFKVSPEEISALEKLIGYSRVMEMFRDIGSRIGEAKFFGTGSGDGSGNRIATRDQAKARIEELKSDKEWVKRYTGGGKAEMREMTDLTKLVVGDSIEGQF